MTSNTINSAPVGPHKGVVGRGFQPRGAFYNSTDILSLVASRSFVCLDLLRSQSSAASSVLKAVNGYIVYDR